MTDSSVTSVNQSDRDDRGNFIHKEISEKKGTVNKF
jgi:hypothetical protein